MKKTIYHVVSGLKVGGAEMFLHRLILSSKASSYQHKIISLTPEGEMAERFRASNIPVVVLNFRKNPFFAFFHMLYIFYTEKPIIVQTWMYHSDLFGGLAAKMAGVKGIIWGVRTTEVGLSANSIRFIRMMCSRLSRVLPTHIVCAAEASRINHIAIGYHAKKMMVIPNGFEPDLLRRDKGKREQIRKACGFASDEVVVGTLGRFSEEKDQENFIRAASILSKKITGLRFLLVGRGLVFDNHQLSNWLENTQCKDKFSMLGERSDVAACLSAMDIFCLSSMTEGFPNVLGEAMSVGLPCVATDVGDAAVLVGNCGIIVPPKDSIALALGLEKIISMSVDERQRFGERGYQRVKHEFSMNLSASRFENLYLQFAERG